MLIAVNHSHSDVRSSKLCHCYYRVFSCIIKTNLFITGEVVKEGDFKCIMGEGMPQYRNPFEKGRLIVHFSVQFPKEGWLPLDKIPQLEKLLPPRQEVIVPDNAEECTLTDYDPSDSSRRSRSMGEVYDEDDHPGMGQRVQCASQ